MAPMPVVHADVVAFLAAKGYPPDEYTVLLTWTEAARTPDKRPIRGYHIVRHGDTEPFDVYSDSSGHLLTAQQLSALGVFPKNWDLGALQAPAEVTRPSAKGRPPRPQPIGIAPECRPPELLELPPVRLDEILQEDATGASTPHKGVTRIGVFQDFPRPVEVTGHSATFGAWQTAPDGGRLWAVAIYSPDAVGQRVHFLDLVLPPGAQVIVYNVFDPLEAYGPYYTIPTGDEDLWSPTCFAELVAVECYIPADAELSGVCIAIDRIGHMYRDLKALPWKAAGWCNLDVACDNGDWPDGATPAQWAAAARGVAGIGSIGSPGMLWCTGSLIADTDPATDTPYFLTANHCVGLQKTHTASSCEFYWLYQRPACGEPVPNLVDVPRTTGGADLLATSPVSTGTDFTLLQLRNAPPAGLTYPGWATAAPTAGAEVTCIHHPQSDYKRISFGTFTDTHDTCMTRRPAARFHQALWHHGTTEGGSSGSPLLLEDTQQIIGQLWGGYAACSRPECPDYYGRFDVTFPVVQSYLHPFTEPPTVDFSSATFSVSEGQPQAEITVVLSHGPGPGTATVHYATADDTAHAPEDYTATTGTLAFTDAVYEKSFQVPITQNTTHEWTKALLLTLSDPQGCTLADTNNPATLDIIDDDPDTDGDTLSDYDEEHGTYGYITDPNNPDTDGDGVDDNIELDYGYDPTNMLNFPRLSTLYVPFFH